MVFIHITKIGLVVLVDRYASLYFCCAVEQNDNELLTLEIIHRYVELLDKYFGSVRLGCFLLTLGSPDIDCLPTSLCHPAASYHRCANWISYSISRRLTSYWMSC